jgi:DNA-binding transcriptional ArsR family regulator
MAYESALAALADPTRRQVFERLRDGPKSVGQIARGLPVSRPAVSQHLKVLKDAGLVRDEVEGTRRVYCIDPNGLGAIRRWLDGFWGEALEAFRIEAERISKEGTAMTIAVQKIRATPVLKVVHVNAPQARAFDVFTSKMATWWPPEHSILKSPCKQTILEPRVGGRWYQVGVDSSECDLGKVTTWQPHSKLIVTWRLNSKFVPDDEMDSEVEVNFIPEGPNVTRVELEHRITAVDAEELSKSVAKPTGWTGILESYVRIASA